MAWIRRALSLIGCVAVAGLASVAMGATDPAGAFDGPGAPQRVVDTRPGQPTADGRLSGGGIRQSGSTLIVPIVGRAGVPGGVSAVALNVTVDGSTGAGFVTLWPCDQPRPTTSNLNYGVAATAAVMAISGLDPDGNVCVFVSGTTHVIIDVTGWFNPGEFVPLPAPKRLSDSRGDGVTTDGNDVGGGPRSPHFTQRLRIGGRGGVPSSVASVLLSVTVDQPTAPGYVTVYPCNRTLPVASNLNYVAGLTVANAVASALDSSGDVCIFNLGATHVIVDIIGWFPTGKMSPLTSPARLLDTRLAEPTFDGQFAGKGRRPGGGTLKLRIDGRAGVPANAGSVVLNITSVGAGAGFATVYPRGTDRPLASNLNYNRGQIVANAAIAKVGAQGDVCLFTSGASHVIVDVVGWLPGPAPAATGPDCPGQTIFPTFRLVALYGNDRAPGMGVFGLQSPEQAAVRAAAVADEWNGFDRPALPTFEFIATVVQASPGADGMYRARSTAEHVRSILNVARANGVYLIIDVQPGRSDFLTEVKVYEEFLKEPDVGIALDPEWRMSPTAVPGVQVGSVSAAEVNAVSAYVSEIVAANNLPEKIFVVHQFQQRMLPDRPAIVPRAGLSIIYHMDGFGSVGEKLATWSFTKTGPPFFNGFKLFYKEDRGLMSPAQVMALDPRPDLITYQ